MNFRPFDPFADAIRTGANLRLQLALASMDEEKEARRKKSDALERISDREAASDLQSIDEMMANPNLTEADRKALRYLRDKGVGTDSDTGMQFRTEAGEKGLPIAQQRLVEGLARAKENVALGNLRKEGLEGNLKQLLNSAGQPGLSDEQITALVTEANRIGGRLGRAELPADPAFFRDPVGTRQLLSEDRAAERASAKEAKELKEKLAEDQKKEAESKRKRDIDRVNNKLGGPSEPNTIEARMSALLKRQEKKTLSLAEQRELAWLSDEVSNLHNQKDSLLQGKDVELEFADFPDTPPPEKPEKRSLGRGAAEEDVKNYVKKLVVWWDGIPDSVIDAEILELGADPDKIKALMKGSNQTAAR